MVRISHKGLAPRFQSVHVGDAQDVPSAGDKPANFIRSAASAIPSLTRKPQKTTHMKIAKEAIPVSLAVPGAIARQQLNFGSAKGYGDIAGEYFSLQKGTDIAPLLKGLESDLCQSPHWGYMIDGEVTVSYGNGTEETVVAGELFYWPPGHSVRVGVDAEIILFSPQVEHCAVVDHMKCRLSG